MPLGLEGHTGHEEGPGGGEVVEDGTGGHAGPVRHLPCGRCGPAVLDQGDQGLDEPLPGLLTAGDVPVGVEAAPPP